MYYYSTNMQYSYDCADGRSRLVWSNDHTSTVTTYAYGAEGLLWSRANGTYQVYHYDYRGSVVAVSDIDGNITDTLEYDAYGSISERTGTSKLIFTYNGQYGVLTDPNGLLYMRTRYYSPTYKRFMSEDVVYGNITDSTSLNRYSYVNGDPISFVDPFELSKESGGVETKYGVEYSFYDGEWYLDYTDIVMNRINEVLPEFYDHRIYSIGEYFEKYTVVSKLGLFIYTPSGDDYYAHVLGNLYYFYLQVDHNAPWDIKRDDPWRQQFGSDVYMPYFGKGKDEYFLFRGELVTRESLGNITYGYLGSAMGIGETTLFWGGGVAANGIDKILSSDVRTPPNYGDDSNDHEAIQKGIDYYYEDYPNARPGINRIFP